MSLLQRCAPCAGFHTKVPMVAWGTEFESPGLAQVLVEMAKPQRLEPRMVLSRLCAPLRNVDVKDSLLAAKQSWMVA